MTLENKTAVIYGGGEAIGGAVARAFAGSGACVYLGTSNGRNGTSRPPLPDDPRSASGPHRKARNHARTPHHIDEPALSDFSRTIGLEDGRGRVCSIAWHAARRHIPKPGPRRAHP